MGKIIRRILIVIIGIILLGFAIYASGPKPRYEEVNTFLPSIEVDLDELDDYIAEEESLVADLKEGNQSRIVWADSFQKTPYAMVYLHGFSASPAEGDPVHVDMARRYGCNLYIPRLEGHGIDSPESFRELTPMKYMNSAKKAMAMGRLLGDTLILVGCSTGATLATYLASEHPDLVHALIMYSPNFKVANPFMPLATGPWGKEILSSFIGSEYREIQGFKGKEEEKYWTWKYRIEGLIAMQALLDQTMKPQTFKKIDLPYFIGYWYKNEEEKDQTISLDAIEKFDRLTQTPSALKRVEAFPEVGAHVMTSSLRSRDVASVEAQSYRFIEEVLGLSPVETYQENP